MTEEYYSDEDIASLLGISLSQLRGKYTRETRSRYKNIMQKQLRIDDTAVLFGISMQLGNDRLSMG